MQSYSGLVGELVLGIVALACILFVGYLGRLQLRELRNRRRFAARGKWPGMIQGIAVFPAAAVKRPPAFKPASPSPVIAAVPAPDTFPARWTVPARARNVSFQWN